MPSGSELDAALPQLPVGGRHIIAGKGAVEKASDAILMAFWREENDSRRRVADSQLDPALLIVEGLTAIRHLRRRRLLDPAVAASPALPVRVVLRPWLSQRA
ncbi:MAG TPA: hypothetical protein VMD06_09325 [Steroidobacteraceae bacterium]|nr:hypothetical protein [Steroidobacteraceae bacterium]